MISGYNFIKTLDTMENFIIKKPFTWAMPVMPEVFTSAPTIVTLPDRHMAITHIGTGFAIYFNIDGNIKSVSLT